MSSEPTREQLQADYDHTTDLLRSLTDVRFRLLAFVPTISGAAVGLLGRGASAAALLAVGALGLVATLGVVVSELRNSQIYDYAIQRAQELEARLGFLSIAHPPGPGGLFGDRPGRGLRILGLPVGHERGLALVYCAAFGGWGYLVGWGALRALDVSQAQKIGGAIGAVAALLVLSEFLRFDRR